jgi:hypothetical protein
MSFKGFIYYCAVCGGWAALVTWAVVQFTPIGARTEWPIVQGGLIGGVLGLLVAAAIGALDAIQNAVGFAPRVLRVGFCLVIGSVGGLAGGAVGTGLYEVLLQTGTAGGVIGMLIGWILCGMLIGSSVGLYDLLRALVSKQASSAPLRKTINGIIGGFLGGLIGGIPFGLLINPDLPLRSDRAISLVILGMCIGLLIGLAQVVLKEAWLRVEAGFRPGREVLLTKDETTIGRAESCDLGLFGDNQIERLHARISIQNHRYVLSDNSTTSGTYLNDELLREPTSLRSGDVIRVGKSQIRFGERHKRRR